MFSTRRQFLSFSAAGLAVSTLAVDPMAFAAGAPARVVPPLLGDAKAPKRFVVFGSYTCPFTAQLFGLLNQIVVDMHDVVNVEWRHFPTHAPDPALHVAGLSFKGPQFWNFTFQVLADVYAAGGSFQQLTPDRISGFAKAAGGSDKSLKAAYADKAKWASVKSDLLAGRLLGVTRTPGLFFNGYFMTPDGIPLDLKAFDASLRAMLKS
jgi:protein-disulfide isomerase